MSFNNWLDVDAAYALASALPENAAVIVKHNNPCGVAVAGDTGRGVPTALRVRHGVGVRRDRGVPRAVRRAPPPTRWRDVFTEVVVAPVVHGRRARPRSPSDRTSGSCEAPIGPATGWTCDRCPAGALVQDRDCRTETPRGLEGRVVAGADRAGVGRPRARVDDRVAREVEHDRVRARTARRWASARGRCRAWTRRGSPTRKAGDRAQGAVLASRRVLPVPRCARGGRRRRLHRRDPPRRFEGRRGRAGGGGGTRHGRRPHGYAGTSVTDRHVRRRLRRAGRIAAA